MAEKKKTTAKRTVVKKSAAPKARGEKPATKTAAKQTAPKTVKKAAAPKPVKEVAKQPEQKTAKKAEKPAVKKTVEKPLITVKKAAPKTPSEKVSEPVVQKPLYPSNGAVLMEVELKKFEIEFGRPVPEAPPAPPPPPRELDEAYGEDTLFLLVRDPEWVFAYWEISEGTRQALRIWDKRMILRWYDVTDIVFNGSNAHRVMDVDVGQHARSWYQQMPEAGRSWCAELGVLERGGRFTAICRSAAIPTPPASMARADLPTEWVFVDPNDPRRVFRIPAGVSIRDLLAAANISEEILREIRIPEGLSLKEVQTYYEDLLGPNLSSWLLGQAGGAGISSWVQSYPGSRSQMKKKD